MELNINTPTNTSAPVVAAEGMSKNKGERKSARRKKKAVEKAVIPVRPPSAIPAELSTKVVTVDVPNAAPTLVAMASAIMAPLMFFTLPASSIISVFAAAPINVPMVLKMSMKTSTKIVRIMSPLNTLLKSICKKVGAMLCGILMGVKSAPILVTPKGIPMRVQTMML